MKERERSEHRKTTEVLRHSQFDRFPVLQGAAASYDETKKKPKTKKRRKRNEQKRCSAYLAVRSKDSGTRVTASRQ